MNRCAPRSEAYSDRWGSGPNCLKATENCFLGSPKLREFSCSRSTRRADAGDEGGPGTAAAVGCGISSDSDRIFVTAYADELARARALRGEGGELPREAIQQMRCSGSAVIIERSRLKTSSGVVRMPGASKRCEAGNCSGDIWGNEFIEHPLGVGRRCPTETAVRRHFSRQRWRSSCYQPRLSLS